ncbi:MAG TPA: radical SAM protein, partial [Candidatus Limnocylindrales bacterium]
MRRDDRVWVYNGLSGQVISLSSDEWAATQAFLAGSERFPAVELLRDLTLGRMIVTHDIDELETLERRYRAGTADRTSFGLTIVTSLGCNFDCPYCFQVKPRAILDDETVGLLVGVLDQQLPTIERFEVTWFGGEPLLGAERLYELSDAFIRRCDAAGVAYAAGIVTNGYLLTPDVARRLRDLRVGRAQVTLDGPAETHDLMRPLRNGKGTFEVILDNVVACADILPISIRVNLDTANATAYESLI